MRSIGFLLLAGAALPCALPAPAAAQETAPLPAPPAPTPAPVPATTVPLGETATPDTAAAEAAADPAAPPPAPAAADTDIADDEADAIVVTGRKPPGSVIGDIPPEQVLTPADIRSYGVSSVAELLEELAPQTRSGRGAGGAPVVLLDGRRIASFSEIRDIPTEAIIRTEILPEEVALKYGYRADQRVVNIVLRRRFNAIIAELDARVPTQGGRFQPEGEGDLLRIRNGKRSNVHLEYTRADSLTEAERNIVQGGTAAAVGGNVSALSGGVLGAGLGSTVGVPGGAATGVLPLSGFVAGTNATDQSAFRTLLPRTESFNGNAVYATSILGTVAASFNLRAEHTRSTSERGLAAGTLQLPAASPFNPFGQTVELSRAFDTLDPLSQRNTATTLHGSAGFNGDIGRWRFTVTSNVDYAEDRTRTETGVDLSALQSRLTALDPLANPYGALDLVRSPDNTGRSRSISGDLDLLLNGTVFALPAGNATTTIRAGVSTLDFDSRSTRAGLVSGADIGRDVANGQVNLDLPIARRDVALSFLGNLSLNGNLAIDHLSDFGTLWTVGYGANWSPITPVRLLFSATHQEEAPTPSQLGNPVVLTPGVRVFDYVQGTTVTLTTVSGGNRLLTADRRDALKVGLDLKPWSAKDINITANYTRQKTDDPIAAFPTPTAAIERAFPDRFLRDADGTLIRLDSRPINFARSERSELRYGVNLSFPIKSDIQKKLEAFRAGTGPNPFEGLRPPGGERRAQDPTRPDGSALRPPAGATATPPTGEGAAPPAGADRGRGPGGGRGFGGGRFGGGGRGGGGGRVQFALYHTWHLTDRVLIADGGPALDLLDGDAIGQSGGQPRHELEGQAGYFNNGLGARASLNFRSATTVNGGTPTNPTTLDFGSLTTVNLRLFADLGQRLDLVRAHPWLRGVRVTASVDNLFNQRQRVTDESGTVPIGFQPGYLDPLGRSVRVSVRKLFF